MTQPQIDLSPAEWMTVSVAFRDAADCGCAIPPAPGSVRDRMGRVTRALFGGSPKTRLADPRLETLRRFVCTTRTRREAPDALTGELSQHGFNPAQIEALALLSA